MQANIEMGEGRARLEGIISEFPPESTHWNEAQNRFQFVDRLLRECLGWEQPYVEVEATDEVGKRADYLLGKPVRAALEAKREAVLFRFAPAAKPLAARKLRPLVDSCSNLRSACAQVIGYCAAHGAQLAIVCNGPQLVIFHSTLAGHSPMDGECFVFDGFQAYLNGFELLWRFLSPEGVYENRAYREIAIFRNPRIPAKAASEIGEPTQYRYRTIFQENLRTLASVLLDDIEDNPNVKSDFYKECYVSLDANNRHLLLSKSIIAARYKRVSDNGIVPAKMSTSVKGGRVHVHDRAYSGAGSSRPIVVIGDVGVGKTSFFENLFEQLEESEKLNTYFIRINLGEEAALSKDVKSYIVQEVPKILRTVYGVDIRSSAFADRVYSQQLSDFDNSPEGQLKDIDEIEYRKARIAYVSSLIADNSAHLVASLSFLVKSLSRQIMVVIDNADQRNFETQQDAFIVAQELAATRNLLVFVALRPATFYQSKLSGALSGYQNQVLTISPPPADEVIRKRITFALRVAEGRIAPAALENVQLNLHNVVLFLHSMLRSIKSNSEIRTFLSNITGGNTRLVIELVTSFCGSPNVESERIVRIEEETGDYKVPLHEFTKHALLGEYAYYNPTSSFVACNVFDISSADPREHFLCPLIVAYMCSPLGNRDNDGFVAAHSVIFEMSKLNFSDDQVRFALRRLARRRLIETPHGHYREIDVSDSLLPDEYYFRATSVGIYHIRYWIGAFSFLDATCTDTPIFNSETRSRVFARAASTDIRDRYDKASQFANYLEATWHEANFDINYYDFPAVLFAQRDSFISVERFLANGPRSRRTSPRGR